MSYIGAQTSELRTASQAVRAAVAVAGGEVLPVSGGADATGSPDLASALDEFIQGWGVGIQSLAGTGDELALSLEEMAQALIDINAGAGTPE